MTVILLGIVWGFVEATLGGVLHLVRFPVTGAIMAPIGFGILYVGMRKGLKLQQLVVIPVIAASMKFIDAPLFHIPFADMTITRPVAAILMQGLSFMLISNWLRRSSWKMLPIGALVLSSISVVAFNLTFGVPFNAQILTTLILMATFTTFVFFAASSLGAENILKNLRPRYSSAMAITLFVITLSVKYYFHS